MTSDDTGYYSIVLIIGGTSSPVLPCPDGGSSKLASKLIEMSLEDAEAKLIGLLEDQGVLWIFKKVDGRGMQAVRSIGRIEVIKYL